jgi:hypothetical protein
MPRGTREDPILSLPCGYLTAEPAEVVDDDGRTEGPGVNLYIECRTVADGGQMRILLFSPEDAREMGRALIDAADRAEEEDG